MRRISTFLLGMATGAMLLHGATMYHVVRAADGIHLIPKQPPRLAETYVDIRTFTDGGLGRPCPVGVGDGPSRPTAVCSAMRRSERFTRRSIRCCRPKLKP